MKVIAATTFIHVAHITRIIAPADLYSHEAWISWDDNGRKYSGYAMLDYLAPNICHGWLS